MMLTNLSAETVGPGMAVAILTTFYGLLAAHLFFLPVAEKLKQLHEADMRIKAMIVRGVLAIQSGEHPRIIQMQMLTFLPMEERIGEQIVADDDVLTIPFPMEEDEEEEMKQAA